MATVPSMAIRQDISYTQHIHSTHKGRRHTDRLKDNIKCNGLSCPVATQDRRAREPEATKTGEVMAGRPSGVDYE